MTIAHYHRQTHASEINYITNIKLKYLECHSNFYMI